MAYSKEEQQSIVRQSSLKFMMEYCRVMNVQLTIKELFKITNIVCDYCEKGYSLEMEVVIDVIDKHIKKKKNTLLLTD